MKVLILSLSILCQTVYSSDWSSLKSPFKNFCNARLDISEFTETPIPVYQHFFHSVDKSKLISNLREMTGSLPVTVNGATYLITDRYSPQSKEKYRAYWMQSFRSLGMSVQELSYSTKHEIGETLGHNLEAILPGKSKDSVVIIVHYDSIGPRGQETQNPGVDDDMTGMAIMFETARLLVQYQGQIQNTVRFVAADYEEHPSPGLEGARKYAAYLKQTAQSENFKIIAAIDNEQTGWNCAGDNACPDSKGDLFDVFSCSGDLNHFDSKSLGNAFEKVAATYSQMKTKRDCIGAHSDHYAMWEIGVPSIVFSEHDPFSNPHFDQNGGDIFDKIDQDYFFKIAQIGATFAATLAGL